MQIQSAKHFHEKIPVSNSGVKLTKAIGEADGNELLLFLSRRNEFVNNGHAVFCCVFPPSRSMCSHTVAPA